MRVDLKAAEQLRYGFMSGGSSTRKAVRPTATEKLALIRKLSAMVGLSTTSVRFEDGHITVRVSPSQELSDWLLDALHNEGQE